MRQTYGLVILLQIFYVSICYSQKPMQYVISGKITDLKSNPLEFVSVGLLHAADSSLLKGTITDEKGYYRFDNIQKPGCFLIAASSVGYDKVYSKTFVIDSLHKELTVEPVYLHENDNTLKEINITYEKPLIERKLDKMIINIENSILATGNTTLELFENLPGVSIDQNGNISLNGKGGVIVYIDGRATNLSSSDLAGLLNGMNADVIEKIELITNPSSKYDAAGGAGIINIRLKKDQRIGLNGSGNLSYGQGFYPRILGGLNLNYRNKKWNLYSNYNYSTIQSYSIYNSLRNFQEPVDNNSYQSGRSKSLTTNNSVRLGTDYFISKKTTIGILLNGIVNDFNESSVSATQLRSSTTILDSLLNNRNTNFSKWVSYSGNLNFKNEIDSSGKQIVIDLNYSDYKRTNEQSFLNNYLNSHLEPYRNTELRNQFPGSLSILAAKVDLSLPFKDKLSIETGLKSSLVENNNDLKFYQVLNNQEYIDSNLSNHFIYRENINAAYINVSKEYSKLSWQIGLRFEQTIVNGRQLTTNTFFSKNYVDFFPSIFLNYTPSEHNQFSLSYNRNINRPSYQLLNPYKKIYDPFNYEEGNPLLNPEFGHSLEFSYILNNTIVITLVYDNSKGGINNVIRQNDSTKTTIITYENIAKVQGGGAVLNITQKIAPWWSTNLFVGYFFNDYQGIYLGQELSIFFPSLNINSSSTFNISERLKAEVSINYLSAQQQGLLKIEQIGIQVNSGIQWQFYNKQASIKLSIKDLFKQRHWNYSTKFQNIDANYQSSWDSRVLILGVTWKFGKKAVPQERKRNIGTEEEKQRINFEKGNG
ncbi:MAG TPA: TonB-dependent receptor [Saprospiraceae bacterium]|nr:TonB-dependent receptor [Saprospiraceae bacterium]